MHTHDGRHQLTIDLQRDGATSSHLLHPRLPQARQPSRALRRRGPRLRGRWGHRPPRPARRARRGDRVELDQHLRGAQAARAGEALFAVFSSATSLRGARPPRGLPAASTQGAARADAGPLSRGADHRRGRRPAPGPPVARGDVEGPPARRLRLDLRSVRRGRAARPDRPARAGDHPRRGTRLRVHEAPRDHGARPRARRALRERGGRAWGRAALPHRPHAPRWWTRSAS